MTLNELTKRLNLDDPNCDHCKEGRGVLIDLINSRKLIVDPDFKESFGWRKAGELFEYSHTTAGQVVVRRRGEGPPLAFLCSPGHASEMKHAVAAAIDAAAVEIARKARANALGEAAGMASVVQYIGALDGRMEGFRAGIVNAIRAIDPHAVGSF